MLPPQTPKAAEKDRPTRGAPHLAGLAAAAWHAPGHAGAIAAQRCEGHGAAHHVAHVV